MPHAHAEADAEEDAEAQGEVSDGPTVLVLGHARSGTAFTAKALSWLGLDIGHERPGRHGVCSWLYAVQNLSPPWFPEVGPRASAYDAIWHVIRDPLKVMASVIPEDPFFWDLRAAHCPRLAEAIQQHGYPDPAGPPAINYLVAAISWLDWLKLCDDQASWRFRVEDYRFWLYVAAGKLGRVPPPFETMDVPENYNGRSHAAPATADQLAGMLPADLHRELQETARRYGYGF